MDSRTCIGKLPLLVVIGAFAASQPALAATDNGTLTLGGYSAGSAPCVQLPQLTVGYSIGPAFGAYAPATLTGGKSVRNLWDFWDAGCSPEFGVLSVAGFSSNPGAGWLTSITCNGVTRLGSAAGFGYYSPGGIAHWTWPPFGFLSLSYGSNVSCSIVHN
jgi:hypothetical protein